MAALTGFNFAFLCPESFPILINVRPIAAWVFYRHNLSIVKNILVIDRHFEPIPSVRGKKFHRDRHTFLAKLRHRFDRLVKFCLLFIP